MCLPSDFLKAVSGAGKEVFKECLGSWTDFAAMWSSSGRSPEPDRVPIVVHEDGVPHFQGQMWFSRRTPLNILHIYELFVENPFRQTGGTATVWSWSTGCLRNDSWRSRHCIAVMATCSIKQETREEICRVLAWDLAQLASGSYPFTDHNGKFWPSGSVREGNAGKPIPIQAAPWRHLGTCFLDLIHRVC